MSFSFHLTNFAVASCQGGSFLGFPTWYKYLPCNGGAPEVAHLNDIWLILAALIEVLLRVAGLVAVGAIIYGGIQLTTSQGEPDKVARAKSTITNALVGLVIAILAAAMVSFIAGRIR